MDTDSAVLVLTTFIALMGGALGVLFWSRLNRIEANMATRRELLQVRDDLRRETAHLRDGLEGDIAELRGDMAQLRSDMSQLHGEFAAMRSDLTYVALAVGARKPRASEA